MIDPEKLKEIIIGAATLGKEADKICPGSGGTVAGSIIARVLDGESPADLSATLIATAQSLKKQTRDAEEPSHLFFELTADLEGFPPETAMVLKRLAEKGFLPSNAPQLETISLALPLSLFEKDGKVFYDGVVAGYVRGVRP